MYRKISTEAKISPGHMRFPRKNERTIQRDQNNWDAFFRFQIQVLDVGSGPTKQHRPSNRNERLWFYERRCLLKKHFGQNSLFCTGLVIIALLLGGLKITWPTHIESTIMKVSEGLVTFLGQRGTHCYTTQGSMVYRTSRSPSMYFTRTGQRFYAVFFGGRIPILH